MVTNAKVVVQIDKDGPLEFVDAVLPDPGPHQVVVKMLATGLCQSQIFWMHCDRKAPVLFGHEGYGVAAQVGSAVSDVREGDPVLVTWVPREDPTGRTPEVATLALPDGTLARSPNVYTWADNVLVDALYVKTIRHAKHDALMSVIACAVITGAGSVINAGRASKGERIAVFGVGGVGLSAVVAGRMVGAERIVAVDLDDQKLAFARHFGATDGINSRSEDPVARIHSLLPGRCGCSSGADLTLDVVGLPATTQAAYASLRAGRVGIERGGRCVIVGVPKMPVQIDTFDMMIKERSLSGAVAGSTRQAQIDEFIDWYQDGHLDLEAMVTHRYRFDEIPAGAQALEQGQITGRAIASCG